MCIADVIAPTVGGVQSKHRAKQNHHSVHAIDLGFHRKSDNLVDMF